LLSVLLINYIINYIYTITDIISYYSSDVRQLLDLTIIIMMHLNEHAANYIKYI